MAESEVYSEPQYVFAQPASALLSETRPTTLTPAALAIINYTLDELLQIWVHAALAPLTPPPAQAPGVTGTTLAAGSLGPGPLDPTETFTTERFKLGVIRVIGPYLGKNTVLEAELALRELLRMAAPSLRADPSLKRSNSSLKKVATQEEISIQADEIFRSLRAWLMQISGLGAACPPSGPATLANHLLGLSPAPLPPAGTSSPHITFLLVLYAERCLSFVAEYLVRAVGRVNERGLSESVDLREVEAAFGEDESIWSWLRGMRIRGHLEAEVAASKGKNSPTNLSRSPQLNSSPTMTRRTSLPNRQSYDSSLAGGSSNGRGGGGGKSRSEREGSTGAGLGIEASTDDFESLLMGGRTMKLSLTPDRLRTMERLGAKAVRPGSGVSESASRSSLSGVDAGARPSTTPMRKYEARAPRPSDDVEVLDEADDDDDLAPRAPPKQSLLDLLQTPPPWDGKSKNGNIASPSGPASAPMQQQDSQNSINTTGSTSDVEPNVIDGPGSRLSKLRAKDERKDLMSERQVNHDLVDFFSAPPPKPSDTMSVLSATPTFATATTSITSGTTVRDRPDSLGSSPAKKRGGFRGFFTKAKSPSLQEGFTSSRESVTSDPSTGRQANGTAPRDRKLSLLSRDGRGSKGSPELNSAAALLAAGFSETAVRQAAKQNYQTSPNIPTVASNESASTRQYTPPPLSPSDRPTSSSAPGMKAALVALGGGAAAAGTGIAFATSSNERKSIDRRTSSDVKRSTAGLPPGLSTQDQPPPFAKAPVNDTGSRQSSIDAARSTVTSKPGSKRSSISSVSASVEPASTIDTTDSKHNSVLSGVAIGTTAATAAAAGLAGGVILHEDKESKPEMVKTEEPATSISKDIAIGTDPAPTTDAAANTETTERMDVGANTEEPVRTDADANTEAVEVDESMPSRSELLDLRQRMLASSSKEEAVELFDRLFRLSSADAAPIQSKEQEANVPESNGGGLSASLLGAAVAAPFAAVAAAGATLLGATKLASYDPASEEATSSGPLTDVEHETRSTATVESPEADPVPRTQDEADEQLQGAMFEFFLSGGNPASIAKVEGLSTVESPEEKEEDGAPIQADEPKHEVIGTQHTEIEQLVEKHRQDGGFEPITTNMTTQSPVVEV